MAGCDMRARSVEHCRRTLIWAPLAAAIATLSGCGGGGGSDATSSIAVPGVGGTGTTGAGNYTLSGTVPGTFIEAFCEDGRYFSTYSNQNGTGQHPFSLSLPVNVKCQLVMTMNELDDAQKTVTPVAFDDGGGRKAAITSSRAGDQVELGFVDLPRSRQDNGFVDQDGDGVNDRPLTIAFQPPSSAISLVGGQLPTDPDGDGIPNRYDPDDDNDGVPDYQDTYDDIRRIDFRHRPDSDGDGIPDDQDRDRGDDGYADDDSSAPFQARPTNTGTFVLPAGFSADDTGGQLLSSMCAQCHGTFGCSQSRFPSLLSEPGETASELQEYIRRAASLQQLNPGTQVSIMTAQAHGYTNAQALAIGNYYLQLAQRQSGLQCGGSESAEHEAGEGYEGDEGFEGYGDEDD